MTDGHPMAKQIAKGKERQRKIEAGARLNRSELHLLSVARYCRDCGGALPFPGIEVAGLLVRDDDAEEATP
jgi:hypothetical protein